MVWFKVDDRFHSHPKAAAASLAALGLWSVAGSWAGDHTTDGEIPMHMIPSLSRGATELADELVTVGLWRRTKAGYRFHQWSADGDGTRRNPTRKEVEEDRRKKVEAGRKGGRNSALSRANASSKRQARASPPAKQPLADSFNPRPDPTPHLPKVGGSGSGVHDAIADPGEPAPVVDQADVNRRGAAAVRAAMERR